MVGSRGALGASHYSVVSLHLSITGLFEMYALIITDGDEIKEFGNKAREQRV